MRAALCVGVWCAVVFGGASTSSAQNAGFIRTVNIDFAEGPILNSIRVIGMGGAFVGIAEGATSHLVNPASLAVRPSYTADDWFDWDFTLEFVTLGPNESNQLDTSGRQGVYDEASRAQVGFGLAFGRHGIGLQVRSQDFSLRAEGDGGEEVNYSQGLGGFGYAYALFDGDLTLGVYLIGANVQLATRSNPDDAFEDALALEGSAEAMWGALWAPCRSQYRVGASWRSRAVAGENVAKEGANDVAVLHAVVVPWQLSVGWSWMQGIRRYNVCPTFGDKELPSPQTEEEKQRRLGGRTYVLWSTDLVLVGPVEDGIGVQAFLQGEEQRSGRHVSVSPRAGVESEVWGDVLRLRGGTYYEPSRFDDRSGRIHATGGGDIHVPLWLDWQLSTVLDVARDYTYFGVGLGFWK